MIAKPQQPATTRHPAILAARTSLLQWSVARVNQMHALNGPRLPAVVSGTVRSNLSNRGGAVDGSSETTPNRPIRPPWANMRQARWNPGQELSASRQFTTYSNTAKDRKNPSAPTIVLIGRLQPVQLAVTCHFSIQDSRQWLETRGQVL